MLEPDHVMIESESKQSMDERAPESAPAEEDGSHSAKQAEDANCNGYAPVAAPEQQPDSEGKEGEGLLSSGRRHRTAALQAAEVIALQAEQSELADLIEQEEGGYEQQNESFDPLTSQVAKGPRTIRKRNPEGHAGGFGTSQLLKERSGLAPGEEIQVAPQENEELKKELVLKAAAVRDIMGLASERGIALREVLKGGVLSGQPVYFKSRHGPILNKGMLTYEGQIACECKQCRPGGVVKTQSVSCSEFEEHAGSRERRPAESIYLECISTSLKEFCNLVNAEERCEDRHAAACAVCSEGGDLLCCDACPTAVHTTCVGLETIPEGEWYCQACTERGCQPKSKGSSPPKPRKLKPEKLLLPRSASKSAGVSRKGSGPAKKSSLSFGAVKAKPETGRVHMAAPAQRAVSGARRERNSNKHKRLFLPGEPGGLTDGQPVAYITSQGEELLKGSVRIDPDPTGTSGILCACCDTVISCSQFEAHAGRGSRRAPYDNIFTADGLSLRKVASMMPSDEVEAPVEYQKGSIGAIADRRSRGNMEPELIHVAGEAANQGGCVLCNSPDFLKGGFGDRTMIICDQCEREFHIGCLAEHGRAKLTELPDGAWFCSPDCHRIAGKMRSHVSSVPVPLDDKYSWQILRGKDGTHATAWALRAAQDILTESFDPIVELTTGADLMMAMVYAQELGDWDYSGMYTAVLKFKGKAVCSAVFRVFGPQMAEVPLVATRLEARRQGHARVLMDAFEMYFASLGVASICLPSAQETIMTWTEGFGFLHMSEERLAATRSELHVLVFPGTELLYKPLNPAPQEATPGAETYPMRLSTLDKQEAQPQGAAEAGAAAEVGAAAECSQQRPEEQAEAIAASEMAVALPASEDVSISLGAHQLHTELALAKNACPAENGMLLNGAAAEYEEVNAPRAVEGSAPAEAAPAEVRPNPKAALPLQAEFAGAAAPAAPIGAEASEAGQPAEADKPAGLGSTQIEEGMSLAGADVSTAQVAEPAADAVAEPSPAVNVPQAKADADAAQAASSAGVDAGKKRVSAALEAAPDQDGPEQEPGQTTAAVHAAEAAASEAAASEPTAPIEQAGRKRRKVAAAVEGSADADASAPAVEVREITGAGAPGTEVVEAQHAQSAEPRAIRKRKAAPAGAGATHAAVEVPVSTDATAPSTEAAEVQNGVTAEPKATRKRKAATESTEAAGTTGTTPESQISKSASRRTLRSNHSVDDTAAAAELLPSAFLAVKVRSKPKRRAAPAELAALESDMTPASSPRHSSDAQNPVSRRALRSQAEPDLAPTPKAQQRAPAVKSTSRRALRSQSSMPPSQEGSRAGTAAASPEETGAAPGSGHPAPVPTSAAVQALLYGSLSPRRRTRSNGLEHSTAADLAPGEPLPCVQGADVAQSSKSKDSAADKASTKQRSLSGKEAGTDTQAEPANALGGSKSSRRASPATAGEAAAQPEEDVPSAAAAGAAGKEAKLLEQDKLTISQPGKDAGAADADQPKDPLQDSAAEASKRKAKKARRSSGLREILSLALESGGAEGASAMPVTWDGTLDNRRASRAKFPQTSKPMLHASAAKGAVAEDSAKAGASLAKSGTAGKGSLAKADAAGKGSQQSEAAPKRKGKRPEEAPSSAKAAGKASKDAPGNTKAGWTGAKDAPNTSKAAKRASKAALSSAKAASKAEEAPSNLKPAAKVSKEAPSGAKAAVKASTEPSARALKEAPSSAKAAAAKASKEAPAKPSKVAPAKASKGALTKASEAAMEGPSAAAKAKLVNGSKTARQKDSAATVKGSKAAQQKDSTASVKAKQGSAKAAGAKNAGNAEDLKSNPKPAAAKVNAAPSSTKRKQQDPPAQPSKKARRK